jgi:hypothetical protein
MKNPHVKIPPISPSTIFPKPCYNQKSNFIWKRIFPSLSAQSAKRPAGPSGLSAQPAPPPPLFYCWMHVCAQPIPACAALAYLPKAISSLSLRSPAMTPSPSVTTTRAPPVGFIVSPTPPLPRAAAPRLGCPRAFTALPHHSPPLIPFKQSDNGP